MNQEKIGKFIAKLRNEKNLTQQELANKIGVTDRAISNWENGRRMPDVSLFEDLCTALDISVNELLKGEKIIKEDIEKISTDNIIEYSKYLKAKNRKRIISLIVLIILIIFIFLISLVLIFNKTFLKTNYQSEFLSNVNIAIPRFTYYRTTSGMEIYHVKLKTFKQPDEVNIFIDKYLSTFEKIECANTAHYCTTHYYNNKNDYTILDYRINNDGIGFINTIYIIYHDGKYCEE